MSKRRITAVLILAVATGITAVIAVKSGINPPPASPASPQAPAATRHIIQLIGNAVIFITLMRIPHAAIIYRIALFAFSFLTIRSSTSPIILITLIMTNIKARYPNAI